MKQVDRSAHRFDRDWWRYYTFILLRV